MRSTPPPPPRALGTVKRLLGNPAPWILLAAVALPRPSNDNHSLLGLPTLCPLQAVTGVFCPGCGITRSLVCCGHGEWLRAFFLHPLGPACFGLLVFFTVLRFFPKATLPPQLIRVGSWVFLVALLSFWIVRLLGWLPKPP